MKNLIVFAALVALTFATPVRIVPDITGPAPVAENAIYQSIIDGPAIVDGEGTAPLYTIRRAMVADINSSPASSIVQIILNLDPLSISQSPDAIPVLIPEDITAPLPNPVLVPDEVNIGNVMPDISAPDAIVKDSIYQSIHAGPTIVDGKEEIAPLGTRSPLVADIQSSPGSSIVQVIVNGKTIKRLIDIPQRPDVVAPLPTPVLVPDEVIIDRSPVEIGNPELPISIPSPVIVVNPELPAPAPVITLPEVLN